MYVCKRESMGADANERQLFHGTTAESISSINTNNFNRRFCGKNGKCYISKKYITITINTQFFTERFQLALIGNLMCSCQSLYKNKNKNKCEKYETGHF